MSEQKQKSVFERLGARHSNMAESSCGSERTVSHRHVELRPSREQSPTRVNTSHCPHKMPLSRKRHEEHVDYNPHKRKMEDRCDAMGRHGGKYQMSRENTSHDDGSTFRHGMSRPQTRRPTSGGRTNRARVRESESRNSSNVKKRKAAGTLDRQNYSPRRNTRYQFVRQATVGGRRSLKKPIKHKTQYNTSDRPRRSHYGTQARNTGTKRKAEYQTRRGHDLPKLTTVSYGKSGSSVTHGGFKGSRPFQKTSPKRKVRYNVTMLQGLMLHFKDEEIAVKLAGKLEFLMKTLDDSAMSDDMVALILKLMEKACTGSTHHQSNLKLVIREVEKSAFFRQRILRWIKQTKLSDETHKYVSRLCTLCTAIIQQSPDPQAAADRVSRVASTLYITYRTRLMSEDQTLNEDILRRIENLNSECERVQSESETSLEVLAINQFRVVPILPDIAEIKRDEPPSLKASLKKGAYDSVDAYLDTTFRLLREDFVAPLRNGISSFIKQRDTKHSNKRLDDVRVYHGVHILNPVCGHDGISHRVQFSVRGLRTNQLDRMKTLCYGSLVCLSSDDFVNGLFGVVANRKPEDVRQGLIEIQFQNPVTDPSMYCKEYVMVESVAFFEAYCPVLEGLQKITRDTLPLQAYIVKSSPDVKAPRYLLNDADQTYDLSPLYKNKYKRPSLDTLLNNQICYKNRCYGSQSPLLDPTSPSYEPRSPTYRPVFPLNLKTSPSNSPTSLLLTHCLQAQTTSNETTPSSSNNPELCQTSHAKSGSPESKTGDLEDGAQKTKEKGSVSELKIDDGNVEENVSSPVLEKISEDSKLVSCRSDPREIDVLNFANWPDESMVHLDDSQLRAVHAALTQELAVIQGPPGTGKTYVGLKIMQVLLRPRNQDVWSGGESGPILVVCYTNHALDQFLEGVLEFERNIVRIGGRSQSEKLKEYNLTNLKRKSSRRYARTFKFDHYSLKDKTRSTIDAKVERAFSFETLILSAENLKSVMKDNHAQGFCTSQKFVSVMCEWLGLRECILQTYRLENVQDDIGVADEGGMGDDQQSMFDFDDFEESRLLDDERDDRPMQKPRTERAQRVTHGGNINIHSLYKWAVRCEIDDLVDYLETFKKEMISSDRMSKDDANRVNDIWLLCNVDRWRLYRYWVDMYRTNCLVDTAEDTREYDMCTQAIREIDNDDVFELLKGVKVIGMTTTGAAKKQSILQRVGARIVVVEEAAEVLEAHVVAALSKRCQHLILIGDHQQLRPNPAVYRLAKQYNLDISLFERMVNSNYPCQTLSRQHRMRPEISEIMRNHFYQHIQDDDSVLGMENIRGLAKNMFFINHYLSEDDNKDGMKSHSSEHEANTVVALCRYILQQGYSPSQITVLTTYKGQLFSIKKLYGGICSEVRVSVVDNYQGEECDIIILSLVRSNDEGNIGFLKTSNRVCVMLSRAKMGLYCIGNFDQLSAKSTLWKAITGELKTKKLIGDSLTLACQLHPDEETHVKCADDFKKVPEGGCMLPCTFRLSCGHSCTRLCHPDDTNHEHFQCLKSCERIVCQSGHKCQKKCYEPCTKVCLVPVERLLSKCNHSVTLICAYNPEWHDCKVEVLRTDLPCGHQVKMPCSQTLDQCPETCKEMLACGHRCKGSCSSCFGGRLHVACRSKCGRTLVCGHDCSENCSSFCPPCEKMCANRCSHSKCRKKCGELCAPCQEPCRWRCVHGKGCGKKCSEPCDRDPCNKACTKMLETCGHQCIGVCGEPCPSKCRVCDKKEVTSILWGNEEEDDARFVQLQDCKHVIEVTGLDKWMTQSDSVPSVNVDEEEGELTLEAEQSTVSIQLKGCPKCKTLIRRSTRYNREIVKMLSNIEAVKAHVRGGSDRAQQIKQSKLEIRKMLQTIENSYDVFPSENKPLLSKNKLLREKDPSMHDINKILNKAKFACKLIELEKKLTIIPVKDSPWREKTLKDLLKVYLRLFNHSRPFRGTTQELIDFPNELHRLHFCCNACSLHEQMQGRTDNELSSELDRVGELLFKDGGPLTPGTEKEVAELLKKIQEGIGALGISEETKIMIVAAMDLKKGHWYKCPNGHVYAIGECGGAMETGKCPECKADIGGTCHKLTSGNAVATEMDGARFPAWSEQANMENYDLQNFGLF